MVLCGGIFMCYLISLCSADINGICSESEKSEIVCCADYYRNSVSGSCLPCIGSFGHNCSLTCNDGYFGHGCRKICECNDSQTCEPHFGCTPRNNHYGSTMSTNYMYIVVTIACILSMLVIGTAFYTRRNILKKFRANSDNKCSLESRDDRILFENASSSQLIGNPIYNPPSRYCLQSQPNSFGGTIFDHNGISQEYQRQKRVLLIPHNTVESGYSEIGSSYHRPTQNNSRDAVVVPLRSNVIGGDCIQAISDENNSRLKTNQNEASVD